MNNHTRRRDDRSAAQSAPTDPKHPHDYDSDRRRNRSATVPSYSYDPRSYPSHDTRYNDPKQSSRSHRQDPHYPPAAPHPSSYHHSSAQAPPTSKAYQHATRPSAQYPSSGYLYPQPSSHQPSHAHSTYPVASSSRKPHPEAVSDPRASRRAAAPVLHSYEQISSGEEMARASRHTSRPVHSSTQPPLSAPSNQAFWNPSQEMSSSRRNKDPYKDRDRDHEREREKEREKPTAELENRSKDRARAERHRERERVPEVRYQEPSRSRHHDRRKDSDTEGALYSDPRNASKVSPSGREGHSTAIRETSNGHRRHRTEDGTASTGRRHQPENTQNPITTMPSQSTSVPPPDVLQTGEPPPAPRVMPVYLPSKAKSQRSHREGRSFAVQGAQSGSDTERTTGKHRMERTPSGPAVQRSDAYTSSSTRDRGNHDMPMGPRDDVKRLEAKCGAHQDTRQPSVPINVDIPLVTPGLNASALPAETRAPIVSQIVSIRAGQGPSDPHDAHLKLSAISHSGALQDIDIHPPHSASTSIVRSSSHARPQPSETRAQPDRPVVVEHSRIDPLVDDLPHGQRVSIHESSRVLPILASKSSYSRGNPETGVDNPSSSYPHSRPPSRSAHRTSANNTVPPAVVGPRSARSASQGPQTSEPPTRPPSAAQHVPTTSSALNQHSVPPSPAHPANSSPSRAGHAYGSLSSAQPSPKNVQLHGVALSHSISAQQTSSALPSVHPTPVIIPQTFTSSSRPSTRDGIYADAPTVHQQSADRQSTVDVRPGLRQTSSSTTVEASWVVQTPATAKRAKISREDKYLRDHRFNSETPHPQLREVLSQEDDLFPRVSSSMVKASQATTPTTPSQRNSPGTRARDVPFGTPRGTSTNNSPRSGTAKEAPTPDHMLKQNPPLRLPRPPQIAVVGATPVTMARDLPRGPVDHGLLVPPFPAPTRAARTTSSSQDQPAQPAARNTPPSSHQPPLAPAVHTPSLFQPYQPPSHPISEDNGQSSPPPLPIPPPRGVEDSPPPPIETRMSEIIPTRSQSDERLQSYVHSVPEVQSEMFLLPSQPLSSSQLPSISPPHITQHLQPSKPDSNTIQMSTANGSTAMVQADARSLKPAFYEPVDIPVIHQEIMLSVPVLSSQSSASLTRSRPKATIEDVPDDTPISSKSFTASAPATAPSAMESKPMQLSRPTTLATPGLTSQSPAVDELTHKYSPQSRNKDPPLHRGAEPSGTPTTSAMAPPTSVAHNIPMSIRVPSSAPPAQPTPSSSAQVGLSQRVMSHAAPSRTYQRAAEMLQASKLSTSVGANPGATGNLKSADVPAQTTHNPVSTIASQHQPVNGVSAQWPLSSRLVNATTAPLPGASAAISTAKAAPHTTTGSGPPVGALGLHISAPSTAVSAQPPSTSDTTRQQPSHPGGLSIPFVDAPPTTAMSTAIKNAQQEQPIIDPTRPRDIPSTTRNIPTPLHTYPTSTRPSTSSAVTQHTHVTPAQPSMHHRVVSLPITSSSLAAQKPPSPRKYSQPIPSTISTQPFPSRSSAPESQPARAPAPAHVFTSAPVRHGRLPPPGRTNDSDMLKTPSSIAPSPILNQDTPSIVPQPMAVPIRARQSSTDSKDDKKKPSGLFGIFRSRTLSSKAADPPAVSTTTRASLDQGRIHPNVPVSSATPTPRGVASTSVLKELNFAAPPFATISAHAKTQSKFKGKVADPVAIPPPPTQATRGQKDATPFSPFKFLSLHSKRDRTVSAASMDVCDGNTATNTVIGSPDHSTVSQAQPLPPIIPPGVRDPLIATTEWRDREEAARRERRTHRIRRPGVTFDLDEEPPSPAPDAAGRRKKLVRRGSGRTPMPGPPRA